MVGGVAVLSDFFPTSGSRPLPHSGALQVSESGQSSKLCRVCPPRFWTRHVPCHSLWPWGPPFALWVSFSFYEVEVITDDSICLRVFIGVSWDRYETYSSPWTKQWHFRIGPCGSAPASFKAQPDVTFWGFPFSHRPRQNALLSLPYSHS